MDRDHIGTLIRKRRLEMGLSVNRLSKLAKVSRRNIARIESGETKSPGFPTVEAILVALGERFKGEK